MFDRELFFCKMSPGKGQSDRGVEWLYEVAVRALGRRARSSGEVRALLARRKAAKADIEAVVHRLKQNGYLDDARFARAFVSSRIENRLEGKMRVRRELAARRVKPELADEAVRRGFEGMDEAALLRQYLQRKLRVSKPLSKPSAVQSLFRRLLRAGFRSDTIVGELKRLLRGPLSKAAASDEPVRWEELLDSLPETQEPESEPRA